MARNTNRQGANFELDVMKDLKARGYTCLRSSGSKGAIDVVAVYTGPIAHEWDSWGTNVLFIQCKISNPLLPPAERLAVTGLAYYGRALPIVAYKAEEGRLRPIRYRELIGPGPKEWRAWTPLPVIKERDDNE